MSEEKNTINMNDFFKKMLEKTQDPEQKKFMEKTVAIIDNTLISEDNTTDDNNSSDVVTEDTSTITEVTNESIDEQYNAYKESIADEKKIVEKESKKIQQSIEEEPKILSYDESLKDLGISRQEAFAIMDEVMFNEEYTRTFSYTLPSGKELPITFRTYNADDRQKNVKNKIDQLIEEGILVRDNYEFYQFVCTTAQSIVKIGDIDLTKMSYNERFDFIMKKPLQLVIAINTLAIRFETIIFTVLSHPEIIENF